MSQYPRIHSICTVGIRQHYNADYLLHPVRTDFTGDNGLGKSIISDLIQLIFIPLREEWKPGTEGLKKEERKIETIPIDRDWVNHAYSFLNIEVSANRYIAIGILISRKRVPVKPFIIQKSDDFENRKNLIPFEKPLVYSDFVAANEVILDLKEVERTLHSKYNLFLKSFQDIQDYHELLYSNQIIPIQLKNKNNLKSFAKVLQSFSRGKTLDITKSSSLQNFLFEDDDEIKASFDKEKDALSGYIRDYYRNNTDIELIEKKQKRLNQLKDDYSSFEEARDTYLKKNALYCQANFLSAQKNYDDNIIKFNTAQEKWKGALSDLEKENHKHCKNLLEQKVIGDLIDIQIKFSNDQCSEDKIKELSIQIGNLKFLLTKLKLLLPSIHENKTAEAIYAKLLLQKDLSDKFDKLVRLQNINHFEQYEASAWAEEYNKASSFYYKRKELIEKRLAELEGLKYLFEGNDPHSLFSWAVKRNRALSIEQETIIMHLKGISVLEIEAISGAKYSLTPESLINSFKTEKDGIWLSLGDIHEYIPLVKKQLFSDAELLQKAVSENKESILKEIETLSLELNSANTLFRELQDIGYSNEAYVEIYKDRATISLFREDPILTVENHQFINDNFDKFFEITNIETNLNSLEEEHNGLLTLRGELIEKKKTNDKYLNEIANKLNKFQVTYPIDIDALVNENTLSDLLLLKERLTNDEKTIVIEKERLESIRNTQKGIKDSAESDTEKLRTTLVLDELSSKAAIGRLEEETSISLSDLFPEPGLDSLVIEDYKTNYDKAQIKYQQTYLEVATEFEESKPEKKNPELYSNDGQAYFSFRTLVNVLCGKIGLEGLTHELLRLNDKRKEFANLQLTILINVFDKVEKQYQEHNNTITKLNLFFGNNLVSRAYKFKIDFTPRQDISIDWIEKMKESARVQKFGDDLFSHKTGETPEELITNIAKSFYRNLKCEPRELLDPKFYFTLGVKMENEEGKKNTGSGGQTYTALALLCIGRLSIVQKQNRSGVRFIFIEELSNIDEKNFNLFPQIARKFGYQLLTMTPKPFGSYSNEEWYLHMLNTSKEIDINYKPMSFFKNNYKNIELSGYINELEGSAATR